MVGTDASICMLLDGPITHDGQSQRTARTLSTVARVLVVTAGGSEHDQSLFGEGVEVRPTVRPPLTGLRKFFLLDRQNDHLAGAALAGGRSFDLVWANDYSTLVPALRVAQATGAKLVYHSHEIWLATINQLFPHDGPLHRRLAFRAIVAICRAIGNVREPRLAAHADVIITANQSFAEVLSDHLNRSDIRVVLNCPERTELQASDRIRGALGFAANDRIVLYQGIMNPGRGLYELVASARDFPDGVRLVMLGGGVLEDSLRRAVEDAGLEDRVFLPGTVPQAELAEWTTSADLGVLVLDPINLSKRLALANKIFEYMGAEIPVLTTDLPENRRILDQCDCGWLISEWSPPVLAQHIARILDQPEEMRRRGLNGRRWFEERYNWDVESRQLLAAVDGVLPRTAVDPA
jgi:glycosyltransferase involved in cell wall biosynthesis